MQTAKRYKGVKIVGLHNIELNILQQQLQWNSDTVGDIVDDLNFSL